MKYSLITLKNVCRNYEITDEIQKLAPIFFVNRIYKKLKCHAVDHVLGIVKMYHSLNLDQWLLRYLISNEVQLLPN